MTTYRMHSALFLTMLIALPGCEWLRDVTTFTVETGWKDYTIDVSTLSFKGDSSAIPEIPCEADPTACSLSVLVLGCQGPEYRCFPRCGTDGNCALELVIEQATSVDLSSQISEKTSKALGTVKITRVEYETQSNSLNFDTPDITFFVGGGGTSSTTDSGVTRFSTLPAISVGALPAGVMVPTEEGNVALANFVKDYKNPFKLYSRMNTPLSSTTPKPMGKIVFRVNFVLTVSPL